MKVDGFAVLMSVFIGSSQVIGKRIPSHCFREGFLIPKGENTIPFNFIHGDWEVSTGEREVSLQEVH